LQPGDYPVNDDLGRYADGQGRYLYPARQQTDADKIAEAAYARRDAWELAQGVHRVKRG
jgi:hypothetical protein